MRWKLYFILILVASSGVIYWNVSSEAGERQEVFVSRVIDGDTLDVVYGETDFRIRLKGINTPEVGMFDYDLAKTFLEDNLLDKDVRIVSYGGDKYGRILAYVFLDGENVNAEILERGLGHLYYYERDEFYSELSEAEKVAREKEIGIWKRSNNFGCLTLIELDYVSEGGEKLILDNSCDSLDVVIKDDATHIYEETISTGIWEKDFESIWNDDGDSLFVWDDSGLVLFERY